MPGPTINAPAFNNTGRANTRAGGQWQASTSGVRVPHLPHGTVPAPGWTALQTKQVAQPPSMVGNNLPPTPAPTPVQAGKVASRGAGAFISNGVDKIATTFGALWSVPGRIATGKK